MFYDSARDPVGSTMTAVYHWKSTSSTGGSTTVMDNLVIPSSPNFPPMSTGSPSRYMINLSGVPFYDGVVAGTHPMVIKNINTTTILTRVTPTGTLTANTYKIFDNSVETPARMEVHVGAGSGTADDVIAYDGYFINNVLASSNMNNIRCETIGSPTNILTFTSGIKIGTGGETAPDCMNGGITIKTTGVDPEFGALSLKSAGIAHGMTDLVETDTVFNITPYDSADGGLWIKGFGGDNSGNCILLEAIPDEAPTATNAAMTITGRKADGTGQQNLADTDTIIKFRNGSTGNYVLVKGNGKIDATDGGIMTRTTSGNISGNPPEATLDAAFGAEATVGEGFMSLYHDTGGDVVYLCVSNGSDWWTVGLTKRT